MKSISSFSVRDVTLSAMVAALYAALAFAFAPVSFGPVQFRVSEALALLPFCLPQTAPGLFVGCFISNVMGGYGPVDIIFGSAATYAAARATAKMPNVWLAALPPVVINALVVGCYISLLSSTPMVFSVLYIGAGQAAVCFCLGVPLVFALKHSGLVK
ncbi:QueT transporter family protein [Synergistes jonesii]|uniref:QueT transporter family protein n=1 Tax=Synergistes jonesii TaxID=2754 RepID=UPI003322EDE2